MRKFLILFLMVALGCVDSVAQEVKKELRTEEDGFEWYETKSGGSSGAETVDGKCLIPLSKKYVDVQYRSPYLFGLYYSDKPGVIYKTEYYTQAGKEILDNSKYDNTSLLGGEDGVPFWFLTKKDGKEGACDTDGNEIVPPIFKSCFYSDGKLTIQDDSGYHKWSEYNANANNSFASNDNVSSKAASIKELFDLAYNTPDTEAQTKYDRYMQVIQADSYNTYGYKAPSLNNLGVLFENLGDLRNAKTCYEYALQANPNYAKAKENLKDVKAKRRSQRWNNIGNVLGTVGQALETINAGQTGGNAYQGGGGAYNESSSGSSAGSQTCKRCQGSGKCSSMSGTANRYYCHGSGKCGYCSGSGVVRNLGQTIVCTACDGDGKCKYCHGSGKCSDCGGSGKR